MVRMHALLMAAALAGGMMVSPVAFAQGRGGQGGPGTGWRAQTTGPTQAAPVGRGQGGVGRGLGPCGGGSMMSSPQGASSCPGLASGQGRGVPGRRAMMGTGAGQGRGTMGPGTGSGMGPPAR